MFPMSFDYKVLETLPLQDKEGVNRVLSILRALTIRRVLPYFRNKRGTNPALAGEHLRKARCWRLRNSFSVTK